MSGRGMMFKEVDAIIRLGKWAYTQILAGTYCNGCLLLDRVKDLPFGHMGWYCKLRPCAGLIYAGDEVSRSYDCPGVV